MVDYWGSIGAANHDIVEAVVHASVGAGITKHDLIGGLEVYVAEDVRLVDGVDAAGCVQWYKKLRIGNLCSIPVGRDGL